MKCIVTIPLLVATAASVMNSTVGGESGEGKSIEEEEVMKTSVTLAKTLKPKPDETKLGFGTKFTDHMFNMDYTPEKGWHNARIEPYGPIVMDPATMVLHYGQGVFEGLKAYRTAAGNVQLFRPQDNFRRLNRSNDILCIPRIDEEFALAALKELIKIEKDWVPRATETSLYIRPTIVATDPFLGVRASHAYRFFIILCPVGAYYPEGFNPVKILVEKEHVRAVPGGTGEAKTLGNYAASLLAGQKAHDAGFTQVLWLDGVERKYIEEVGSMNIFFVIDGEVVTPALQGSILPGITRDSVLQLGRMWGMNVSERRIAIDDVLNAGETGKLQEVFGSGTAAVISPVGQIKYGDRLVTVGDGQVGPLAKRFYAAITDIQYGRAKDPKGWIVPID
jgi:branched-chain amino acid aminotransferase